MNAYTALPPEAVPGRMTGRIVENTQFPGYFEAFLPSPCVQNHAANLAFLADGTLTCVWFGGTMEGMGDISIYMSRLVPGSEQWTAPQKMSEDPAKSEQNPLIFQAPDGAVWLLFTSQTSGNQDGSVVKCRVSEDGGRTFGEVRTLCDLPGTFVRQPIIVNGRGAWLLPVFLCRPLPGRRWTGDADTAGVLVSSDQGRSWELRHVPESLGAVHMNIVPRGEGRMVAFFRNRFATRILRSVSGDDGLTWSAPQPTELPNNNSSIQAIGLKRGSIAMIYNHSNAETSSARRASLYDEIEGGEQTAESPDEGEPDNGAKAIWGVPRAPLSLSFSDDDGLHFSSRIDLDTGDGYCLSNNSAEAVNREFSYPSIVEDGEGRLHAAYTYYRRAIKYVRLPALHSIDK